MRTDGPTIHVVGGGIGGLTVAAALHRKGFDVQVYEGAPSYADVGGGHWMYTNALDTLERIDPTFVEDLEALGANFDGFLFTDNQNRRLLFESTAAYSRPDRAPLVLRRADIIEQLAKRVPADRLNFGKRLETFEDGVLTFQDGTTVKAELVIGADGIHSRVRNHALTSQPPRNSGQIGLWGMGPGPLPEGTGRNFQEMWGDGLRFGFTYVGTEGVYWFMVVKTCDIPTDPVERQAFVLERAKAFPEVLSDVVRKTDPSRIHTNPLFDIAPLSSWHTDTVCCLGDAVHACTPNLGQGGCQAIEDGYWLAEMMEKKDTPKEAFAAFQRKRWWRVAVVVYGSRWLGQFGQLSGRLQGWVRNTLVWLTPSVLIRPMLSRITTLPGDWHTRG